MCECGVMLLVIICTGVAYPVDEKVFFCFLIFNYCSMLFLAKLALRILSCKSGFIFLISVSAELGNVRFHCFNVVVCLRLDVASIRSSMFCFEMCFTYLLDMWFSCVSLL